MYDKLDKLASAVHNNIMGGLSGAHTNYSISLELIKDTLINERLTLINQYINKGMKLPEDLYISINCISLDCDHSIEQCNCNFTDDCSTNVPHFEIPQFIELSYIGSVDKSLPFIYFTSYQNLNNHKYRKRGKNKPYVWIDQTPNKNGLCDCFVFNAPLLDKVSVTGIFKDSQQLLNYDCCTTDNSISTIDSILIDTVTKKLLYYYRQLHMQAIPNNQTYTPG